MRWFVVALLTVALTIQVWLVQDMVRVRAEWIAERKAREARAAAAKARAVLIPNPKAEV